MRLKLRSNRMEDVEGMTIEYPYTIHMDQYGVEEVPWHWHEELEINYLVSGAVDIMTPDKTVSLKSGQGCFVNSNIINKYEYTEKSELQTHFFHPILLSGHYKSVFETKYVSPVIQNKKASLVALTGETKEQQEILIKLKELGKLQEHTDTELQTRNIITEIWLLLIEEIKNMKGGECPVSSANQERLQNMLRFIHENYEDKISLEDIAQAAMISGRECLRCFNLCLKETPIEYLTNYRINIAKDLLRTTNKSITDIALETGFSNSAYFTKVFKQVAKMTPREYRKGG